MNIKKELYNQCISFVNKRLQTIEDTISLNQNALQSEIKSSAGDKHETGRAMLQLEMEKAGQQLSGVSQMKHVLAKIDVSKSSKTAHLGSLIFTNKVNYFLSISAGKLTVLGLDFFAISVVSPIGILLLGKKVREEIVFNDLVIKIQKIN